MSKTKALDPAILRRCAGALRTLSHPARLRIVEQLECGPRSVGDLAEALGRPQATTSQHLMRLRAFGLVEVERDGRTALYRIRHRGCLTILNCIRTHFSK